MIAVIERSSGPAYTALMRFVFLRFFALVAVLLMPFGMSAAPAAMHHGHATAAMPMQHCPDQNSKSPKGAVAECTMACAAALPAADVPRPERMPVLCLPVAPTVSDALNGLHPETATPPPKLS